MALSITYTPPSYTSIHNDVIYTVADAAKAADPITYPQFKFIGDVYIGSVLVARIKKIADPITGIGIFNIGPIVRNYVAALFAPVPGVLVSQELSDGAFFATITMKFGEEWSFTPVYDIIVDSARKFYNVYNKRLAGVDNALSQRLDTIAGNGPMIRQTFLNSTYNFLNYFCTNTSPVSVTVTVVGGGSGFITSFTPSNAFDMHVLNLSPQALNAIHPGAITTATESYKVQIGSSIHTYKLICESIFQTYTLHFLNEYGGFDSKIFTKVSRKTYDIERKDFTKLPYTIDGAGQVSYKSTAGVYNEQRSTYSSLFKEKLALNSDLLTDDEYIWLLDLLVSPLIYIEDNGYIYPIVITDTNYEQRKHVNDDLTNLVINVEFGNQLNAQFR